MIVLCAHRLYTPREEIVNPLLFIEDGLIASISSRAEQEIPNAATVVDFNREDAHAILAPGFVDIHMHGGAGIDVMLAGTGELPRLNGFLTTHGVTGYFPTTVTAPLDQTYSALGATCGCDRDCPEFSHSEWRHCPGSSVGHSP